MTKEDYGILCELVEHLEYTGYGDSWERECATHSKLPDRAFDLVQKYKYLNE